LRIQNLEERTVPAQFTPGNLVALRMGDGTAAPTSAATAEFLDEFKTDGTPVNVGNTTASGNPLPTATSGANVKITDSGTATSAGLLTRSTDGQYLVIVGYDSTVGTSGVVASAADRVVGRVDAFGNINSTTHFADGYTANNLRSATSVDGTAFWTSGTAASNGGVRYVLLGGTTTTSISATPSNVRAIGIFGNQLYSSSASAGFIGVSTVGSGVPTTTGQSSTLISATGNGANEYQFYLLDRDATVAGLDTMYVADQTAGLEKYSWDGSTWTARGTVAGIYTGLVAQVNGSNADIYVTSGTATNNSIVKITDSAAFNATISGSPTTLVSAGTNKVFRGLAFAPVHSNKAPVNVVPGSSIAATEDTPVVVSGISVSDPDAFTNTVKVTLSVNSGTVNISTSVSGGVTSGQVATNSSASVVITAPMSAINATLADANGLTFTPTANAFGNVTLNVLTNDQGNSSNDGSAAQQDSDNVTIAVAAVADDPSITDASTAEDTQTTSGLVFTRNAADGAEVTHVKIIAAPTHGTLYNGATALGAGDFITYADANANLKYTPSQDYNGSDTFQVQASTSNSNAGLGGAVRTATITISAVNDAPVNAVPGTQSGTEDTALVFSSGNGNLISISDVDAGSADVKVTLTTTNGILTLGGTANLTVTGNGTGSVVATGKIANINTALDGLTFQPAADFNGAASVKIATDDQGNTGSGGAQTDTDTVTINLSAVNDAPVNSVPGTQAGSEDTALVFSSGNSNLISISDVDAASNSVQITLTATHGTLTLGSTTNLTVSGNGTTSIVASGTIGDLNNGLAGLTFNPDLNYNGSASVEIVTDDQGNTGSGGALTDDDTVTINLAAVNDAPVNAAPGTQSGTEDTVLTFSSGGGNLLTISDVDAGSNSVQLTLMATHGTLTLGGTTNLTVSGNGSASVVATGTIADINTGLDGLTFTPAADYNGAATVQIVTDDQGNTGSGGAQTDTDSVTVNLSAVNDPPVNSVPATQSGTEDTTLVFSTANGNLISVSDVDAGAASVKLTLQSTHGTLLLSGTANLTVTGDGTSLVVANGSIADLNAAIAGLKFLPDANYNGAATVQVITNDLGNTGSGGPWSDTDSVTINLAAVNDAPVNTLPPNFSTNEDEFISLPGVSVSDVDAGSANVTVTFTIPAAAGKLRITGGITGGVDGTQITGNNSPSVSVTAPMTAINTTLADSIGFIYFPTANFNGNVALGMTTNDNGNTGGSPASDTDSANISVASIDDAPFNVVPGDQNAQEDVPLTFSVATGNQITVGDVDATTIRLTLTAQHGTLQYTPVGGLLVAGNGTSSATAIGTIADLNTALSGMTYTSNLNYNGTDLLNVFVDDQGSSGSGGPLTYFQNVFINVNPTNDAPVNTVPGVVFGTEDTPFAFTGASTVSISDIDAGTGAMSVTLSALHGNVTLPSVAGVTINNNSTHSVTASGNLTDLNTALAGMTYQGDLNYNGSDTFTILTDDGGNTGAGGALTDSDSVPVTLLAVNDAPVFDQNPYSFFPTGTITVGELIGTVHAVDPEGDGISYSITAGDPGNNFTIDANTGAITVNSLTGLQNNYSLTVTATDNNVFGPASSTTTVLIAHNTAPTTIGIPNQQVNEDSGAFNLDLSAFFNDADQTSASLTYTIVSDSNAALFQTASITGDMLTLTPVADGNGNASIKIRATDTPGLFVESTFTFTVNPVNDKPTIGTIGDMTIPEDNGLTMANLTGISAGPANESAQTLTITATSSDTSIIPNPSIQYTQGSTTGTLSFTPVANAHGPVDITVTVNDNAGGTDTVTTTFHLDVLSVDDRPLIDTSFTPLLPAILKNPLPKGGVITGVPISTLLAHASDPDGGTTMGIAVTGFDTKNGHWEFTIDSGTTWTTFPAVSDSSALLLDNNAATQIRFIPNVKPKGKSTIKTFSKGFADITYRAWDESDGNTTVTPLVDASNPADLAFSAQTEHAWVVVGKATPVIDFDGHPVLKPISLTAKGSAAYAVKSFLGLLAKETDPTKTNFGIAVSGTTGTGTWQFNTGKGGWQAVGTVDDTQALLLRPTDKLKFVPAAGFNGDAQLTYHTWDQTSGTFGTKVAATGTSFSTATEKAIANAAPIMTAAHPTLPSVAAGATSAPVTVATLLGTSASDVEQAALGVYVSAPKGGTWEYSTDGVKWTKITKPIYLSSTTQLRFTALATAKTGAKATLSFKAWDMTLLSTATLSKAADKITVVIA
jgi:hypothetical protein